MGDFQPFSEHQQHARQYLEPQIFFIAQSIHTPLDDADLVIQSFDEAERDLNSRIGSRQRSYQSGGYTPGSDRQTLQGALQYGQSCGRMASVGGETALIVLQRKI